ncbi:metallophosphoesterase [Chitinimonas viridis]|uniref:Metallophosphoesterase n=1 Tax=Chitinimonas viridis TaxID=664880 RepID=A0ABT8B4T7_9NEIS|nr:metallophosphoesterase [Chitinimonas viridis]MBL8507729.1 metallophosphoesterase [Chitinimonas sp.]MDN3576568.1 metallophosphoesterase [Chitinimonas viridis]
MPDTAPVTPRVAFLPRNEKGRDFVVGDLHGCRRDLEVLLVLSGFNPDRGDRLFATGDLVDRGPDAMGCLKLLAQPWFYCVLGNHEQMLLNALTGDDAAIALSVANGGGWALGSILKRDPALQSAARVVERLPHVLVVGPGTSERFNVVHAALLQSPADMSLYRDADLDAKLDSADDKAVERLIWSRNLADEAAVAALEHRGPSWREGLSLTYCGHNPVPYPVIHQSHCHIDTGSGYEGNVDVNRVDSGAPMRLTMAEHNGGNPIFYTR